MQTFVCQVGCKYTELCIVCDICSYLYIYTHTLFFNKYFYETNDIDTVINLCQYFKSVACLIYIINTWLQVS